MNKSELPKKVLHSYLLVSILTVLAATIGMMVDGIVVGSFFGTDELAAMGLASPIFLVTAAIGSCFSSGSANRCSYLMGKGDKEGVLRSFTATILGSGVLALLLMLVGLIWLEPLSLALGATEETLAPVMDYMQGILYGVPFIIISTVLMALVRIDGSKSLPLLSVLLMTVVNITLDLMVAKLWHIGMFGMGLATSAGYLVATLVTLWHFTKPYATYKLIKPTKLRAELMQVGKIGLPTSLNRIFTTLRTVVLNNMLLIISGIGAVTALTVRTNVSSLSGAVTMGVAQAILPTAGLFFGETNREALRITLKEAIRMGLILNVITAVALYLLRFPLISLFGVVSPQSTVAITVEGIISLAISTPLMVVNLILLNFYQSTRNTAIANTICFGESILFVLLFSVALAPSMNTTGIWVAFVLGEAAMLIGVYVIIALRLKRLPRSIDDFMLLPADYDDGLDIRLDTVIGTDSQQLEQICAQLTENQAGDKRRDELMEPVVKFMRVVIDSTLKSPKYSKRTDTTFNVRICCIRDRVQLKISFYGAQFNPLKQARSANADAADKASGFKLDTFVKQALSHDYRYTLGINVLTLNMPRQLPQEAQA